MFDAWLEQALTGGAGAAHRLTEQSAATPQAPAEATVELHKEGTFWQQQWARYSEQQEDTKNRVDALRRSIWKDEPDQRTYHIWQAEEGGQPHQVACRQMGDGMDRKLASKLPEQG